MLIYVIACRDDKFYVGKTNKPLGVRYNEHKYGRGSWFTKKYKPMYVYRHFETDNDLDEDFETMRMMKEYGIENVRGGSYIRSNLEIYQLETLEKLFVSAVNRCFKCKKKGHFSSRCNIKNNDKTEIRELQETIEQLRREKELDLIKRNERRKRRRERKNKNSWINNIGIKIKTLFS